MRLTPLQCPECGAAPRKIIETVEVATRLTTAGTEAEFDFEAYGGCEVLWDSQRPALINGKVTLWCAGHHSWLARMD